jgi:hypothetical protein
MRTLPNIRVGVFKDPDEREEIKKLVDHTRQTSGALSRSVFPGQSPAANPIPSGSNPGAPAAGQTVPTPQQGDLLYGLSSGSWAKLPIGAVDQFLVVSGSAPAWSSILSGALSVIDNNFSIVDDVDSTKIAKFQCSGITPSTTRTFTVPNANTVLAGLAVAQTFTQPQIINSGAVGDVPLTLTGLTSKTATFGTSRITASTTRTTEFLDANGAILLQLASLQYVGQSAGIP